MRYKFLGEFKWLHKHCSLINWMLRANLLNFDINTKSEKNLEHIVQIDR